jgi:hypothetical protein
MRKKESADMCHPAEEAIRTIPVLHMDQNNDQKQSLSGEL